MTLTILYLQEAFAKYNREIFDGSLPMPALKLSRARTRLGQMACKKKWSWGRVKYYDYVISVSTYYDLTQEQIDDVLIHEMIHYSIAYTGVKDTSPHGVVFRGMMDAVNRRFGRHVTVTSRSKGLSPRHPQKPKEYLVLGLVMKDGRRFLSSVNPRFAGEMELRLSTVPEVKSRKWIRTSDEYFRSFPLVRTLRARQVSASVFDSFIGTGNDDAARSRK